MSDIPTTLVGTPNCPQCGKGSFVKVPTVGLRMWQGGAFVQDAFPQMSASERELLITGTHPECWDKLFPKEGDE